MRKSLIVSAVFICVTVPALAEQIDLYRIAQIESSGNPTAYNHRSQAAGLFQITPICLKEYNTFNKTAYTKADLFNPSINRQIADWYLHVRIPQMLKHFKKPITTENILLAYNCGISCVTKGRMPSESSAYIRKYLK